MAGKPILKKGPASVYAGANETIYEFSFGPTGKAFGGLLSMRVLDDGELRIEVYRTDGPVRVMGPTPVPEIAELLAAVEEQRENADPDGSETDTDVEIELGRKAIDLLRRINGTETK